MKKKISVIIPVYNVNESYLSKCIESVINQIYNDLEIIIIDDGSKKEIALFLDEYSKKDKRIKVFHRTNHGVSSSRNYGIEKSTGDYISFLDSDDFIDNNMYSEMIEKGSKEADIISSGLIYEKEDGTIFDNTSLNYKNPIIIDNIEEGIKSVFNGCLDATICTKLFKKSLIKNNRIIFDESIHSCEDMFFLYECVKKSKLIYYTNKSYYHYVKRIDSVTNAKFNPKILTYEEAYDKIISDLTSDELIRLVQTRKAFSICKVLYKLIDTKSEKKIIKKHYNNLKDIKKYWKHDKSLSKRDKAIINLMYYNPYIGTKIWKIYKKTKK